jgi:predicted amidohydrolase YtcJ
MFASFRVQLRPPSRVRTPSAVLLPAAILVLFALPACEPGPAEIPEEGEVAELILTDARIYTLAWGEPASDGTPAEDAPWQGGSGWTPDAEAVAMAGGRILTVGSAADVEAFRGSETEVLELDGAVVIPGIVDSHAHILSLGNSLFQVDLVGVGTEEEAVERVVVRAREVPEGSWIVGRGWDEGAWANRYPDRRLLSEAVPDHPVLLRGLHGFATWANDRALEAAGITAETEAPTGGEILVDDDGEPTGVFLNRAVTLMDDAVPPLTREEVRARVEAALETMASSGYVGLHDAGTQTNVLDVLHEMEAEGALPIRVYAMLNVRDEELARAWLERGPSDDPESFLRVRSVKAYYDAALGSRGARLLEDYSDQPGHRGISGEGYGFNQELVAELMEAGFQVGIHAIGDAGNREVLDFIQGVAEAHPSILENRHRIEHAQVVHPDDFPRFGELEVVASMEPPHAVEDKAWAEDRLGPERIRGAYAWRTLREHGAHLTFNSDLPGSDWNIFYGLHAGITRRDRDLEPPEGWYPNEALTSEETVRAYTSWTARAAFLEDRTGVIEAGRWADLTVMDVDPFQLGETSPGEILDGRVLATIVAGRVVWVDER